MIRVGHGFDVHAFGEGDQVVLGGVSVACDRGLIAHSDGDVVLHALCDALLGAAGLGDIGQHFPDHDEQYKGADSQELLRQVVDKVADSGWAPVNVDVTVMAQKPKLAPHIPAMRACIAACIGLDQSSVNIKATTTERLGFVGREEGIAAEAVALVQARSAAP